MNNRKKFKKGTAKNEKAITLIALIVSIIVLLILAGVSIAVLTGENGILNRATEAKQTNEQKTAEEELKLGIVSLSTDYYSKTTRPSTFREFIFTEESEADLNKYLSGTATFDDTNYTITYKNILYEVEENGTISKSEGIILDKTNIDNLQIVTNGTNVTYGETTINATTVNLTGNITWSVKNNSSVVLLTPSADGKTVTIRANQAGDAVIVASCSGKTKECSVTVTSVTAVTSITLDKSSGTVNAGDNFVITATTNGTENLTWSWEKTSGNTSLEITTSGTGKNIGTVVGSGAGIATVTVSAPNATAQTCTITVQEVGYFKTEGGVAKYYTSPSDTAGTAIDSASKMEQYLGKKVGYTKGGEYRIFYVDVNNKYGNGAGTIYLKADYNSYRTMNLNSYSSYDTSTTKVREMNPTWKDGATSGTDPTTRGNNESNWNINEQAAAYLCTPTNSANATTGIWKDYFDNSKADFVIGSPSAEMYCDSYSVASHTGTGVTGNYKFEAVYDYSSTPGYKYKYTDLSVANATPVTEDYTPYEGNGSLDYSTKYKNMYCGVNGQKTGNWWLASPSSFYDSNVCNVGGSNACLSSYGSSYGIRFCPLVSLKSGVVLNEVAE